MPSRWRFTLCFLSGGCGAPWVNLSPPIVMYSPTLEEFLALAKQGNVIPVTRRFLADFETPLSAYHKIRGQGESFLFESVEGGEHLGRYSFVGCNPRATIRQVGNRIERIENGKVVEEFIVSHEQPGQPIPQPALASVAVQAELTTHGRVEQVAVSFSPDDPPQGKAPEIVRDGLEVVERVMKQYRPVS